MTASGTYTFSLENAELIEESFERIGIDSEKLTARHTISARRSMGILFAEWSTKDDPIWRIERNVQQTVTEGDYTLTEPSRTLAILQMLVRRDSIDTEMTEMSRQQYMSMPNKTSEGFPNQYYFDRQLDAPVIYLWPAPENSTDVIVYDRVRMIQDVGKAYNTPDIPTWWYEALVTGLAAKLAAKFKRSRLTEALMNAKSAYTDARTAERDRAPTTLTVSYRRR